MNYTLRVKQQPQRDTAPHTTPSRPQRYEACGEGASRDGFTCGLWQLLHATSVALPDEPDSGARWLAALEGFAQHLFLCSECSEHFLRAVNAAEGSGIQSRTDAIMWLWQTHNRVSKRLKEEEGDTDGRHEAWPSKQLCPSCFRESDEYKHSAVLSFLEGYYSTEAVRSVKQTPAKAGSATWTETMLIVLVVAVALVAIMRQTPQYVLPQKLRSI